MNQLSEISEILSTKLPKNDNIWEAVLSIEDWVTRLKESTISREAKENRITFGVRASVKAAIKSSKDEYNIDDVMGIIRNYVFSEKVSTNKSSLVGVNIGRISPLAERNKSRKKKKKGKGKGKKKGKQSDRF